MRRWLLTLGIAASAACGQHYVAEVQLGSLGDVCSSSAACMPPLLCDASNTCQPSHAVPAGGFCLISDDCAAGLYCDEMVCAVAGVLVVGDTCTGTGDCTAGLVCALAGMGGRCVEQGPSYFLDSCATEPCMAGLRCDPYAQTCGAAWPAPSGATCETDEDCDAEVGFVCEATAAVCHGVGPDDGPVTAWSGVSAPGATGAFRVLFEVPGTPSADFYRLPYPNDARLDNGRIDLSGFPVPSSSTVSAPFVERLVDAVANELGGFAPNETVFFRFSAAPKFCVSTCGHDGGAACPDGCMGRYETRPSVLAVDLTSGPRFGTLNPVSFSWQASTGAKPYLPAPWLAYSPSTLDSWDPGHTYAVLIHTRVRGDDDSVMAQDADFAAMLQSSAPTDARLARAHAAYAPLRAWLATNPTESDSTPITASDLGAAAVFTVRNPTDLAVRLAAAVAAEPAPTVADLTLCSAAGADCSDPGEKPFYEVHGTVSLPIYQHGDAPYLDEGGGIAVDANGGPQVVRREDVRFVLTVPDGAAPALGWPVVIYAHGADGDYREAVTSGIAEGLASVSVATSGSAVSFAVLTVESVAHGPRRGASSADPATLFFNLANPQGAKGNMLQAAADVLSTVRLVAPLGGALAAVAGLPAGGLDASRVAVIGRTEGASASVVALAHAGAPQVAVLAGVDAFLIQHLMLRTAPFDYAAIVRLLLGEYETPKPREHPVLSLLQGYWDDVDPVVVAPYLTGTPLVGAAERHLLQVVGVGDPWVPNAASLLFARRATSDFLDDGDSGLLVPAVDTVVTPPVSGNDGGLTNVATVHPPESGADASAVLFDRTPDAPGNPTPAFARMLEFLGSWWAVAGGAPTIAE